MSFVNTLILWVTLISLFLRWIIICIIASNITFVCVLLTWNHESLVDEGCKYFNSMSESYFIIPRMNHCIHFLSYSITFVYVLLACINVSLLDEGHNTLIIWLNLIALFLGWIIIFIIKLLSWLQGNLWWMFIHFYKYFYFIVLILLYTFVVSSLYVRNLLYKILSKWIVILALFSYPCGRNSYVCMMDLLYYSTIHVWDTRMCFWNYSIIHVWETHMCILSCPIYNNNQHMLCIHQVTMSISLASSLWLIVHHWSVVYGWHYLIDLSLLIWMFIYNAYNGSCCLICL